ncbi:MAG: Uma2 family endonuclease [Planctomycetaceae bacterium]|nr:Uma2 family endonuclease [Planctomycetaceae bacterium]
MSTATASTKPNSLVPRNVIIPVQGITWDMYEELRTDPGNNGLRMYYADGKLLLMTVGYTHERIRALINLMLMEWLDAQDIPSINAGQWTLRQSSEQRGLESDNCYYIRNLDLVEGKPNLDLAIDPPPDLAVEVDITTESEMKFAIYSSLQVPELWVWDGDSIQVYRLMGNEYLATDTSTEVLNFPLAVANEMILEHHASNDLTIKRKFRNRMNA